MSVRRLAAKELQPASFAFSEATLAFARAQVAKYPEGRQASAVIAILWRVQEEHEGWVSEAAIRSVADFLGMPYIRALEVATFYTMFQLQPVGKKAHVQVCGTTPCRLRGAGDLIEVCKSRIHHDQFALSGDGAFSWEEVECAGACVNAPMVQIFKDTYEDLTVETFTKVLDGFAAGHPPKPGPQNGRQFSAPLGGPTTLKDIGATAKNDNDAGGGTPLHDTDAKKPGASADARETPAPAPPGADRTQSDPPSGDPAPKPTAKKAGATPGKRKTSPGGARKPSSKGPKNPNGDGQKS